MEEPEWIRCPRCGATRRLVVHRANGDYRCLQCGCRFSIREPPQKDKNTDEREVRR